MTKIKPVAGKPEGQAKKCPIQGKHVKLIAGPTCYIILFIIAFSILWVGPLADIMKDETIFSESFLKTKGMYGSKCKYTYTASQKHESTLLHTYVLNEFLTADRSVQQNISENILIYLLRSNWSIIRATVRF